MFNHIFVLLLPGVFCQFDVRPDVRFDEMNERFDISPFFDPGEYKENEDYRRMGNPSEDSRLIQALQTYLNQKSERPKKTKHPKQDTNKRQKLNTILHQISRRLAEGRHDDFAWHDDMKSAEQQNFERNLEQFRSRDYRRSLVDYLHGGQPEVLPSRRSAIDSEKEVLLHHAVPIAMKVKGYLQAPRVS